MNQPEIFGNVVDIAQATIEQVEFAMFELPTPCSEWNVRQLMNHMAVTCRYAASIMNEQPPAEDRLADHDVLGADLSASFAGHAATAVAAFGASGAMDRVIDAPPGKVPGAFWADFPTWDLYVHTWDLARATGVHMNESSELSQHILNWGRQIFSGPRDVTQIGEPVDVADSAPAIDQLVGLFGRDPVPTSARR